MNALKYPNHHEIMFLKGEINYTTFYMKRGNNIVSSFTLKYHQAKPYLTKFIRVNKSYLLNPDFIAVITKGKKITIKMTDGTEVNVSRRRIGIINNL